MKGGATMLANTATRRVYENSIVKVTIDYGYGDKEEMRAKIVAEPMLLEDEITINSPVGRAIYRRKEGDHVEFKLPNGKTAWITIEQIEV